MKRTRPLIGVTTSEVRDAKTVEPTPEGEPPRHEMALGLTYLKAIEMVDADLRPRFQIFSPLLQFAFR